MRGPEKMRGIPMFEDLIQSDWEQIKGGTWGFKP
jgi:hypothetical protein